MTEIERENKTSSLAEGVLLNAPAPEDSPEAQGKADHWNQAVPDFLKHRLKHREKSIGEKIFNRTVYTGIGFGANEVFSMLFTGMFERGPGKYLGREGFEKASDWMARKFRMKDKIIGHLEGYKAGAGLSMTKFGEDAKIITKEASARNLLMWASLNFIGCFVVPAVKVMDGYKGGIVKWLNHRFDNGKSEEDIAARDREVAEAIACEPAQTWGTLIMGRLVGMATAIGLGGMLGESGNGKLKNWFGDGATRLTRWGGRGNPDSRLTKIANNYNYVSGPHGHSGTPAHQQSAFTYYTRLAGPETLGCLTTSVVLEAASKHFARTRPHVKDPKLCAEVVAREEAALKEKEKKEKPVRGAHTAKVAATESDPQLQTGL